MIKFIGAFGLNFKVFGFYVPVKQNSALVDHYLGPLFVNWMQKWGEQNKSFILPYTLHFPNSRLLSVRQISI